MLGPKKQEFWPKINMIKGNHCILRTQGSPVLQKLGMILEDKVFQKLKLEKNGLLNWYSYMIFFWKNIFYFWHRKLTLKVQFRHFLQTIIHCCIVLKQFPLSMFILGQQSCILGPTIFKILQPNWNYYTHN